MGLEGNLKDFDLADILQLISLGKKTGALNVGSESDKGAIFFEGGAAVFASAGDIHGDGAITRILRWRKGSFIFKPDETAGRHNVQSPIMHLVLEAARQIDEWEDIQKLIPSLDLVLAIEEKPPAGTEDIQLQPLEWKVLATVDGSRPITQIIKDSHLGDFETCKVLYGLLSSGLLKVLPAAKPAQPEEKPQLPLLPAPASKPAAVQAPKPGPEKRGILGGLFGKRK
ncbi:DUF4388 domain-containing protein [candidate division TA06 bacterium]|uniref:DUF4388 domain-containing protein n=1 Tax=candidate division TA06 bacterium TaxID=2250710 RepID=A0A933ID78_UNCT6|nr:DUF4388 domain-containing protein [candidate division TA06 bacterium]